MQGTNTLDITNPTNNTTFYGYLYNWCAAMGGQLNACNSTTGTPQSNFDTTTSICPAGWRLPGGGSSATTPGNDFGALNTAINSGSTSSDSGLLTNFLAVYSGYYNSSLGSQGSSGYYWSSTVFSGTYAYYLYFASTGVYPGTSLNLKTNGFAVRCIAG